ncbi:MAG: hypothetical protein M4579_007021 [Chaenotheca gracillima]|nr:MAG: hypothetical protein M4579_007021 [Chaenotheca gracillima]
MAHMSIRALNAHNLQSLRSSPLAEISGSLGDLGTLLPLMIALALQGSISLSSTLVFSGLANILTGIFFGVPLPVQPMKAIAAVAISRSMTRGETASAGLFVAGVVFLFSATGLLRWFTRVIPTPVVKGIQVGAGLSLILSAGSSLLQPLGWVRPSWADNLPWAIFAFVVLLLTTQFRRFPYALFIFILGVVFSFIVMATDHEKHHYPYLRVWHPSVQVPTPKEFRVGALDAGLGQLPLTTLNSIIAVSYLSADLLPELPTPTTTALGFSVAGMNLVGCWFGAMPVCHGSGGLAGQYKFGARSGASIILLGAFKLILGLVFGESLVYVLKSFPKSLLGIMVIAAGLELAKVGESLNFEARDLWEVSGGGGEEGQEAPKRVRQPSEEERQQRWATMLMTVGGLLAFRNDAVGFVAGMLCHWSFRIPEWSQRWGRSTRRGGEQEPLLA